MDIYDAIVMLGGLPVNLIVALIFCATIVFIFLPIVLGMTYLLERVVLAIGALLSRRAAGDETAGE